MAPERRKRIFRAVTILTVVAVLGCAVYIMACRLGLSPDYDFGAPDGGAPLGPYRPVPGLGLADVPALGVD